MRWLETLTAKIWWRGRGAELLRAELDEIQRERVEDALAESPFVSRRLADMLRRLGPRMRAQLIAHFASALLCAEEPEGALFHTIRWLASPRMP